MKKVRVILDKEITCLIMFYDPRDSPFCRVEATTQWNTVLLRGQQFLGYSGNSQHFMDT